MNTFIRNGLIILYILGAGCVVQVFACAAVSFNQQKATAMCSESLRCPSQTDTCLPMNPHSSYGTCCLGCGNPPGTAALTTCSTWTDCPPSTGSVRYVCKKPIHQRDALGICCTRPSGTY